MVRGNWERRAEIAANRRAESKVRKEEKKTKTKNANGESVYNKLLCFFPELKGVRIDAWLQHEPKVKCCSLHMRTEECNNRRCPFSHDCCTLASYPNIQPLSPSEDSSPSSSSAASGVTTTKRDRSGSINYTVQEDACFLAPLSEVLPRHRVMIRFVAVDGQLVFDEKYPSLWENYISSMRATVQPIGTLSVRTKSTGGGGKVALSTVVEQEEDDEDGVCDSDINLCLANVHVTNQESDELMFTRLRGMSFEEEPKFPLTSLSQQNLQHVFVYLSIESIGRLMCVCKYIKHALLLDDNVRIRRREAYSLCSADESKRRKNEKKKKVVAGNAKKSAGKKDGLRAKYCV